MKVRRRIGLVILLVIVMTVWLDYSPPSHAIAGDATQIVHGMIGTSVCIHEPMSLLSVEQSVPSIESDLWDRRICAPVWNEHTHPFQVTPGAALDINVTASLYTSPDLPIHFEVTPSPGCGSVEGDVSMGLHWHCVAPASGQMTVTIRGYGYFYTIALHESGLANPETLAGLQRINEPASTPYIIYVPTAERAAAEDTQFIDIWRLDENTIGQPLLYIAKEALLALPAYPIENLLIATSPDELVNVYKLTTGEYQVNLGPLADGKVYTTIFDAIPPTHITHSTWVVPSE